MVWDTKKHKRADRWFLDTTFIAGGYGTYTSFCVVPYPPVTTGYEGCIHLSPHRQPHPHQGIMVSGPCLNTAVVLFHSALAQNPRCVGKPNLTSEVAYDRPRSRARWKGKARPGPSRKGFSVKALSEPAKPEEGKGFSELKKEVVGDGT